MRGTTDKYHKNDTFSLVKLYFMISTMWWGEHRFGLI